MISKRINDAVLLLLSILFFPILFFRGNQFIIEWIDLTDLFVNGSFLILVGWFFYKILLSLGKGVNSTTGLLFLSAVTLWCLLLCFALLHGLQRGQQFRKLLMYSYLIFTITSLSVTVPHDRYLKIFVCFIAFCAVIYVFISIYLSRGSHAIRFTTLVYAKNESAKNTLLMGLVILWAMVLYVKKSLFRLLMGLSLFASLYLLVISGSKAGLAASAVCLVTLTILTSPFYKKTIYIVGSILLALSFAFSVYKYGRHRMEVRFTHLSGRDLIIGDFLDYLDTESALFGKGLESWPSYNFYEHPHNFIIELLSEFGFIIGGTLIIFTFVLFFVSIRNFYRWNKLRIVDSKSFLNSIFLFSLSLVSLTFSMLTGQIVKNIQLMFFFGIYIAYWLHMRSKVKATIRRRRLNGPFP